MRLTTRSSWLVRVCVLSLSMTLWGQAASAAKRSEKPNVVLIFADDLGWKDVGFNGTDFYETPNLDRLRKQGMAFNQAYVGGANCQPSRACLMSGQYTPRHGVYAVGSTDRGPKNLMRMIPVSNTPYLETENYTMAEALRDAGYATAHFGKWHLNGGKGKGTDPTDQGFQVSNDNKSGKQKVVEDPKGCFADTDDACNFMEENKDRPFFIYLAHHAVHSPHQARAKTLEKFEAKEPGKQHNNALYAACINDLDTSVGILLKKLADLELDDNTIVVFTSDNGGTPISSQEPLRGNKGAYYEGGIREPFIVRWPGVVKAKSSCDTPVMTIDLYPTFLAAAGVSPRSDKTLDGENIRPLLDGGSKLERKSIFWHFPGYLDAPVTRGRDPIFRTRPVSAIHKGDWKLFLYHEEWQLDGGRKTIATNNAIELYNLKDDEGEHNNVANSFPTQRDELLDDLLAWFKATDAKLPTEANPKYDPDDPSGVKYSRKGANRKKANDD